jgi:hypothetical protein
MLTVWTGPRRLANWSDFLEDEVEVTLRLTVSMSWHRVPFWDLWPESISCRNVTIWNLLSCIPCSSVDALRRTQYTTPVGSLENAVLCCTLFTRPYHSNDGAVLLGVSVAVRMLWHSNEHLQISTVADRLSMFATCARTPWKAHTYSFLLETESISKL